MTQLACQHGQPPGIPTIPTVSDRLHKDTEINIRVGYLQLYVIDKSKSNLDRHILVTFGSFESAVVACKLPYV